MTVDQPVLFAELDEAGSFTAELPVNLAPSRATDPRSSVEAGRSCSSNKQMVAILEVLSHSERHLRGVVSHVTADDLRGRFNGTVSALGSVERNAWSSRLAAMERKGLLERCGMVPGRYKRHVVAFKLTDLGRAEAERLRAHQ